MKARSRKKRFVYFIILVALFLSCVPFIVFYSLGYDIGSNFIFFKTGGIYVFSNESGTNIYVDGKLNNTTSLFQRGTLVKNLSPKKYDIKVGRDGYLDWHKFITVKEEQVAEAYPFLLPTDPEKIDVPKKIPKISATSSPMIDNPEYLHFADLFAKTPNDLLRNTNSLDASSTISSTTLMISNGKLSIEKDQNSLKVSWDGSPNNTPYYFCTSEDNTCKQSFTFFTVPDISSFDFYPSRNDLVLVASNNKLFVVELDSRPPQNIVTLYKSSKDIDFRVVDNETLVIKEDKTFTKVKLVNEK